MTGVTGAGGPVCNYVAPTPADPLARFYTPGTQQLPQAEQDLLDHVRAGKKYDGQGGVIRPDFLRAIIVTKDEALGASFGVNVSNVVIPGDIDLAGQTVEREVAITRSLIEGDVIIRYAKLRVLRLDGSTIRNLEGIRVNIATSIYLRWVKVKGDKTSGRRFVARGKVDLSGSKIDGAVSARGAHIGEQAHVGSGKAPDGLIDLEGKPALDLSDANIGSVLLGPKDNHNKGVEEPKGVRIDDCIVNGGISFQRARCISLNDCQTAYKAIFAKDGELVLRGFHYDNLGRLSHRNVSFRKKWLDADARIDNEFDPQPYEQLATVLRNQGESNAATSIHVIKRRKLHWEVFRRVTWWQKILLLIPAAFLLVGQALLEIVAFGYRPYRVIWVMLAVIALSGVYFNHAYKAGMIEPSNILVARSTAWQTCRAQGVDERDENNMPVAMNTTSPLDDCVHAEPSAGLTGPAGDEARALSVYPDFNGLWYAMDVFLPVVSLRQQEFWMARGRAGEWFSVRWNAQALTFLGWLLSTIGIGSALSYLNRR